MAFDVLCVVAFALSILNLWFLVELWIDVKSTQKSTHQVQLIPADKMDNVVRDEHGFEILDKETKEKLENDDLEL